MRGQSWQSIAARKRKSYRTVCLRDACMFGSVLIHGHVFQYFTRGFLAREHHSMTAGAQNTTRNACASGHGLL
jgi:hypothetical protein